MDKLYFVAGFLVFFCLGSIVYLSITGEMTRADHQEVCRTRGMSYDYGRDSCVSFDEKPWDNASLKNATGGLS